MHDMPIRTCPVSVIDGAGNALGAIPHSGLNQERLKLRLVKRLHMGLPEVWGATILPGTKYGLFSVKSGLATTLAKSKWVLDAYRLLAVPERARPVLAAGHPTCSATLSFEVRSHHFLRRTLWLPLGSSMPRDEIQLVMSLRLKPSIAGFSDAMSLNIRCGPRS